MIHLNTTNPKKIAFLSESYEKEAKLRTKWCAFHANKFQEAATYKNHPKNYNHIDIAEAEMVAELTGLSRDHIVSARHRIKIPKPDYLSVSNYKIKEQNPVMIPVGDKVNAKDISCRKAYLKERYKLNPEDKYYFTETSNFIYGWRLADSGNKLKGPAYPKVNHIQNSLISRVGLMPDPEYYGAPV